MYRYIAKTVAILATISISTGCSNRIDNFDLPNGSLSGAVLDIRTNDTVPTTNNTTGFSFPDGALNIYQQNYSSTEAGPQGTSFTQEGTYFNRSIFEGTYKGIPLGAFYADTIQFTVKGNTKQDFQVAPFLYVKMKILVQTDSSISVSYQAKSNDSLQHVSEIAIWLSSTAGVNRFSWYGSNFNPVDKTTYRDDHNGLQGDTSFVRTFTKLQPKTTYYLRAGAVASGNNPQGYWNYSKTIAVTIAGN